MKFHKYTRVRSLVNSDLLVEVKQDVSDDQGKFVGCRVKQNGLCSQEFEKFDTIAFVEAKPTQLAGNNGGYYED